MSCSFVAEAAFGVMVVVVIVFIVDVVVTNVDCLVGYLEYLISETSSYRFLERGKKISLQSCVSGKKLFDLRGFYP